MGSVVEWPTRGVRIARQEFQHLVQRAEERFRADPSDDVFARFLLIRSSGYLEYGFETTLCDWAAQQASPRVAGFVKSSFGKGRNPSPEKLGEVLGRFDVQLRSRFESRISEDDGHVKREINWMIDRRNKIVHGLSENVGSRKSMDIAKMCHDLVDWLIEDLRPDRVS